jgi:hypothetical protein
MFYPLSVFLGEAAWSSIQGLYDLSSHLITGLITACDQIFLSRLGALVQILLLAPGAFSFTACGEQRRSRPSISGCSISSPRPEG